MVSNLVFIQSVTLEKKSSFIFTCYRADPANYEFEFRTVLPVHTIHGRYTIDGKFMMLPIKGEGNTRIVLSEYEPGKLALPSHRKRIIKRLAFAKIQVTSREFGKSRADRRPKTASST